MIPSLCSNYLTLIIQHQEILSIFSDSESHLMFNETATRGFQTLMANQWLVVVSGRPEFTVLETHRIIEFHNDFVASFFFTWILKDQR